MGKFFNPAMETMPREEIQSLQLKRFQDVAHRVYARVPFYRQQFDAVGMKPQDIRKLTDIQALPFTTKDDMRKHSPYGLFAVPKRDIIRVHASSGTTGQSTTVGYTRNDIENWAECVARVIVASGVTPNDIVQISFGYGLFTGAFGLHYGMEKLGAMVIPVSSGNTRRQIEIMQNYGSTVLIATPSYAMYLNEAARQMDVPMETIKLRRGLFGAEGHSEEMRTQLQRRWGIRVTENYGLSEVMGPGVSGECIHQCGMHIAEDHFLPEIIDPDTGDVLPYGETGELVLTTLTKEGLPLIRYRTKDITKLIMDPCVCGRTLARMQKVSGRSDDMLIIRGVNVFPSQIENVLMGMRGLAPHYEIIIRREGYMDALEILVEVSDAKLLTSFAALEAVEHNIHEAMRSALGIDAKIQLVEPLSLKRFEGKAQRITDLRDKPF